MQHWRFAAPAGDSKPAGIVAHLAKAKAPSTLAVTVLQVAAFMYCMVLVLDA